MSRLFLIFWVVLHVVGFGMSMVQYKMKDNLNNARGMFGWSFGMWILPSFHTTDRQSLQEPQPKCCIVSPSTDINNVTVDVIFILFPVCRNFISLLRRTPLNSIIPFDRNVDFHSESSVLHYFRSRKPGRQRGN
jgi:hypothetical protein